MQPARISVRTVVPFSLNLNQRSSNEKEIDMMIAECVKKGEIIEGLR